MLRFMRRPGVHKLQRRASHLNPRTREHFRRQEQFARRYGLRILHAVIFLAMVAIVFQFLLALFLWGDSEGWLRLPRADDIPRPPVESR